MFHPAMEVMEGEYTIHRMNAGSRIPEEVWRCEFFSITGTREERSLVCPKHLAVSSEKSDEGWACIRVVGPLDLALTGVLAEISGLAAQAGVGIFAVATYDTDYILVKRHDLEKARASLEIGGFVFVRKDAHSDG